MRELYVFLFAIGTGFTTSGIVASLYRLCGFKAERPSEHVLRAIVLIIAGPCVLAESALAGVRSGRWHHLCFWAVTAAVTYWSLALGLVVIDLALRF